MTTAERALAEIAHDLYGLPPAEFTAARNARAARAKSEGDPGLAAAVKALRKPAVAGWVVNLMVRQLPERIADLTALGEELRSAQDDLDAATLRGLTAQRRKLTASVAREGAELAAELGQKVTAAVTEQVQTTLHAAMTDEVAATAVRSGVLLGPLEATGLDEVDLTDTLALPLDAIGLAEGAVSEPARGDAPTDLSARRASKKAQAAKEVTEAKTELSVAEAAMTKTGKTMRARKEKVRGLQAQVLQLRAELDELLREVNALEERLEPITADLETAQDAFAEAEAMDIAARAAVEKAQKRLTRAQSAARR